MQLGGLRVEQAAKIVWLGIDLRNLTEGNTPNMLQQQQQQF